MGGVRVGALDGLGRGVCGWSGSGRGLAPASRSITSRPPPYSTSSAPASSAAAAASHLVDARPGQVILPTVSGVLGGDEQARLRATLAASQLVGAAVLRYVMKVAPLATLSGDELVGLLAPTVTRYLTADARELGLP